MSEMIEKFRKLLNVVFGDDDANKLRDMSVRDLRGIDGNIAVMVRMTNDHGEPNINQLWKIAKDIEASHLNIKFFGYELARQLAAALPVRTQTSVQSVPLACKASTQTDIESDWLAHWCSQLGIPVVYHRKIWEYAYVLQTLHDCGMLESGRRGLGFGCGQEPIPSYLTALGVGVTVTDLPTEAAGRWAQTNQHSDNLDRTFRPHMVSREEFVRLADFAYADMNDIPETLRGYDFCWSICALEHLGSIKLGLDFIENALDTINPGGVAVHTTEYNCLNDLETMDNWPTVLFQRRHFQEIHDRLIASGHDVAPLNFDIGNKPMDKFIDLPPYGHDWTPFARQQWNPDGSHLKLNIDGFATTCFGLVIRKRA
jgi:2-polyprenyl-3-methyl-5-hydroxy-6-metoxy-1,4-benzoquinol methylase